MRRHGLQGVVRGRKRRTTIPGDQGQRPADLVDRDFTAAQPNRLRVADFTYVMTWSGVVYVAFVIDAFSRRIVGWKADTSMKTALVLDTLEMALWSRQRDGIPLADGMVFHNDAGSMKPGAVQKDVFAPLRPMDGASASLTTPLRIRADGPAHPALHL